MCEIPVLIDPDERIVRAIVSGCLNKSKTGIKPRAFRAEPGTDEVSVIRHTYMGSDFCKAKGRERAGYVGLAVLHAKEIRQADSEVFDSRDEFCGHAHISHGILAATPNEPLPPQDNLVLDKKLEALRSAAVYHPDLRSSSHRARRFFIKCHASFELGEIVGLPDPEDAGEDMDPSEDKV